MQQGAELLTKHYGKDVMIRFNCDRKSGGAWLVTHENIFTANAEIGICATLWIQTEETLKRFEKYPYGSYAKLPIGEHLFIFAHIGNDSLAPEYEGNKDGPCGRRYAHVMMPDANAALDFLKTHAVLRESY